MKVSVLMAVYNEEKYIKEAIDSVLCQKLQPGIEIEICIVDDCSTDNTYKLIRNFYKDFVNIKIYRNHTKGKNNAWNLAYKNATGSFFIFLAGDDMLEPNTLKKRIQPLLKLNKIGSVTLCKLQMFSENSKFDGIINPKARNKGAKTGGCLAMNKKFADKIFPIPCVLPNEDTWILCGLEYLDNVEIIHVPIIGLKYRIHSANSVPRNKYFSEYNNFLHERAFAYSLFIRKYQSELSRSSINRLEALIEGEEYRYKGFFLKIIFMKNMTVENKTRMFFYSNSFLYWIKVNILGKK